MRYITTDEVARKWNKILQENMNDYFIILDNNTPIWLLIWKNLADTLIESWVLDKIKKDLNYINNA